MRVIFTCTELWEKLPFHSLNRNIYQIEVTDCLKTVPNYDQGQYKAIRHALWKIITVVFKKFNFKDLHPSRDVMLTFDWLVNS